MPAIQFKQFNQEYISLIKNKLEENDSVDPWKCLTERFNTIVKILHEGRDVLGFSWHPGEESAGAIYLHIGEKCKIIKWNYSYNVEDKLRIFFDTNKIARAGYVPILFTLLVYHEFINNLWQFPRSYNKAVSTPDQLYAAFTTPIAVKRVFDKIFEDDIEGINKEQKEKKIRDILLSDETYSDSNSAGTALTYKQNQARAIVNFLFDLYDGESVEAVSYTLKKYNGIAGISSSQLSINDICRIADEVKVIIRRKLSAYPLFGYLFEKPIERRDDILFILESMTHADAEPMSSLLVRVDTAIRNMVKHSDLYTENEVYQVLGWIANKIGQEDREKIKSGEEASHRLDPTALVSEIQEETGICTGCIEKIIFDFKTNNELASVFVPDCHFKFRHIRLIFAAVFAAKQINKMGENLSAEDALKYIELYFPLSDKPSFNFNEFLSEKHDTYCFFAQVLLLNLDSKPRRSLIEEMVKIASCFDVSHRARQISYIYILTTVLADIPLDSQLRDQLFEVTFGKTLYEFQALFLSVILEKSKYFQKKIEDAVCNSCNVGKADPPVYYLSYALLCENEFGRRGSGGRSENFLKITASLQAKSWYPERKVDKQDEEELISLINKNFEVAFRNLIKTAKRINGKGYLYTPVDITDDIARYTYGTQLLSYAASNLIRTEKKVFNSEEKSRYAIAATIFSDYYMRLLSNDYCTASDSGSFDGFLLCGSYRLVCAGNLDNSGKKVPIDSEEMLEKYELWLKREMASPKTKRYAVLMARLLSCIDTDRFDGILDEVLSEDFIKDVDFLNYDNVEKIQLRKRDGVSDGTSL